MRSAVRLIAAGFLDRFDEEALASHVGYSARQLRRLFAVHVGASPTFVARSRRAHFARRLLDESDLSLHDVAAASGFGSARQMQRVMNQIFHFPPAVLRAKRAKRGVLTADGGLRLRIPIGSPLDVEQVLTHLGPRLTPGVESLEGSTYRRTVATCGHPGVIELDVAATHDTVELVAHLPAFDSIIDDVARIRHMLGLDESREEAVLQLGQDALLGPLVRRRPHVRVIGGWDRFEVAVRVIIGQQVSVAGATTTAGRLTRQHGTPLSAPVHGLTHLFPTPAQLAPLADDPTGHGMPTSRARSIGALACAVLDGGVDLFDADPAELRAQLVALPGIGPWTAEVTAMRAWRDPDVFPAGDLGLRHAIAGLLAGPVPSTAECRARAAAWAPHRALAAQHLWASLDGSDPGTGEDQ